MAEKRKRGRPRQLPEGAKMRHWWATDAEYARVQKEAKSYGCSAQELVRRRAIRA